MDRGQCPAPYRIAACGFQILIVYLIDGLAVFGYELKRERVGESGSFICATALIGEERRGGCDYWILVYLRIRQVPIQFREYYLMPPRRDRRLGTSLILSVKVE
jgi:hypothetical protein